MRLEEISELPVSWHRPPPMRFVSSADLETEGEALAGRVVFYDGQAGALSYDRTRDVGLLILEVGDEWKLLSLEKGQLGTTVRHAIAMGNVLGLAPGDPRFWMSVRYLGENGKAKRYRATAGLGESAEADPWPA